MIRIFTGIAFFLFAVSMTAPVPGADIGLQGNLPSNHQDSFRLGRVTSAVMPADGLLQIGIGGRTYSTVYQVDGFLERVSQKDLLLSLEAGPLPWLQVGFDLPYRTWNEGVGWIPDSGSGLGDGQLYLTSGRTLWSERLHGAIYGGSNIVLGSRAAGLTEGSYSPHLGGALTWRFWLRDQLPEMRLHLNFHHRWNKSEYNGYGAGTDLFEPWYPRYPGSGSDPSANDQNSLGAAVEFRKGTTAIWVEYTRDTLANGAGLSDKEQFSAVGAGMRWGVMEGWAVHADYQVSLSTDDRATAWDPAYPDLVMEFGVSKQFSIGGRDSDRDGIPDRHDHCPLLAEDRDGFQDEDGCPDNDNDQDGIPDNIDGAPDAPEDFDGWEDLDGIPDPDNDGDGIFDWLDNCPDQAEDMDGHRDQDGCPDVLEDRDGDGIEDAKDLCPDQAEDFDGFEDEDGCPDLDNDLDGIPDALDACPDEPEDYDGDRDDDGCPD